MQQTKLDGVRDHPLAKADQVLRIESDPASWIHDRGERCPCPQCRRPIRLDEAEHVVVTLAMHPIHRYDKRTYRLCSAACYREWATDGMETGW